MEINGINFNGKHSFEDFNLIMNSKTISTPSKNKIKIDVPYMNGVYDFSTIGSNGEITYNQRAIEVRFTLICDSKAQLHSKISEVAEWLQDNPQSTLIFDDVKDYYYMAEFEDSIDINEDFNIAEITIKFIAEPFKTSINYVGADIWDTFNFLEDITQTNTFDVVTTDTVILYNHGRQTIPTITVDADMSVIVGGITYNLSIGDNKIYSLKLLNGYNDIVINGTGNIVFLFKKISL